MPASRPTAFVHGLLIAVLVFLSALAAMPLTTQAQPGCVVTKFTDPNEPVRWLENCGQVDPHGDPEKVARQVIAGQAGKLGLSADSSNLSLLAVQKTQKVTHVRFSQQHLGVPVYLGQILVQYDASGVVQLINNHTLPNLNVDVTPKVDASTAQTLALAEVAGSNQLRAPIQQELVIYGEGKQPELAWHFVLYTQEPVGDWHVMIAAEDGTVLGAWDEIWYATGSGLAYNPNAVQGSGVTTLNDNNDSTNAALAAARVTLTLNNLADDTNQLRGSYVDLTGTGVNGCSLPYTPGQANEPTRVYNYTRDDDRFEEVNVYAAIDGVQSWFQALGFTNVNNRSIPVDAHCISDDNSYYSSSDKALHFGDGGVDDAEDADIVIHEYGHSVHDNQVPGWGPSNNTEQRAMGEGFGDFLAGMYYINDGDPTYLNSRRYCIGEWDAVPYNPVVSGNSGSGCLRWIDGRDQNNGNPIGAYSGTPSQEHSDGRYWSAALTCIYEGMGANASARDNVMRLVLQHHFSLTPDSSNQAFEQAVAALLLADQNLFSGANQELIAQCALARNLIAQPQLAIPTIIAPAEGAQFERGSTVTISWDPNGAPANATYEIEYAVCAVTPTFSDTVEDGVGGWTVSHVGGSEDWAQVTSDSYSPTHSWFAGDAGSVNDQYLISPAIEVGSNQELRFWHLYNMERSSGASIGYDGGVVEISTNGGATWNDLGPQLSLHTYNLTISTGFISPIGGRQAFSGNSGGWVETAADLSGFAGQTVQIRFRQADDSSSGAAGWWVDDIRVQNRIIWTPLVTTGPGATSYEWTTPATSGTYCLRMRSHAPDYDSSKYSAIRSFNLIAPNTAPTISPIADITVEMGAAIPAIDFTVGDAESAPGSLTVSGSSSNQTLLPDAGITFGGSGADRTLTLTPAAGQVGSATVTITVSDGDMSADTSFVLTVNQPNAAPTISSIADIVVEMGAAIPAIDFTVGDAESAPDSLTLSVSSSNQTLLPDAGITFGGSGADRTLTLTPAAGQVGSATVTITVSDGDKSSSTSFVLTVTQPNTAPTISSIADIVVEMGAAIPAIGFTVGDAESAPGSLTLSVSSSNPTLLPNAGIVFGGSGANRTLTLTPAAGQVGSATITITVSDGDKSSSTSFVLTVNAAPEDDDKKLYLPLVIR